MRRKLDVTYDDMMQLRAKGYSNKDIANMLEISVPTVRRYIGNQGCRMESVTTTPERCGITKPQEEIKVKVLQQVVAVNGYGFAINMAERTIRINIPNCMGEVTIYADEIEKLKQALDAVSVLLAEEG